MTFAPKPISIVKAALVLLWVILAFILVQKTHVAQRPIIVGDSHDLESTETFMSVFFKGQKIGYSEQDLIKTDTGYLINQNAYLHLNLMGEVQELRTVISAILLPDMTVRSFNFIMSAGPVNYQLSGRISGRTLELTSSTGGRITESQLELESVPRLTTGLLVLLAQKGLEKGQRFTTPIFDPATLSTKEVLLVVEEPEKLNIDGETIETIRVRQEYRDTQSYIWVDLAGRTVKEEGLMGLSMVRTTEAKAKAGLAGRAELVDMVTATSAPADRLIDGPREVKYLKVRLKGLDLTGFELDGLRQHLSGDELEVRRETIDVRDETPLPITNPDVRAYLAPEYGVQSRDPKIINQARALAPGQRSPLQIIEAVTDWVFKSLEKRPTMSVPSAVDVLAGKVGDCNEHAILTVALLRAAGVPARMAVGVLYFAGRFYYHAWVEAYFGRWLAIDPLQGQVPADATHIRFLTGDLTRQTEMIRVIGRLQVEILEFK